MSDIRSAEDVAREVLDPILRHAFRSEDAMRERMAALIRARDAEVRADEREKVLAGFTRDRDGIEAPPEDHVRAFAQALADAGLLAGPEHDAAVAAEVLREAADEMVATINEHAGGGNLVRQRRVIDVARLRERAEKAEAESDALRERMDALRDDVEVQRCSAPSESEASRWAVVLDRDAARDPQPDPDTVTLPRYDVEALLSQWEDRGYHETDEGVDPLYSRVRASLGWGDSDE